MNIFKNIKTFLLLTNNKKRSVVLLFIMMAISIFFDVMSIGSLLPLLNLITQENLNSNYSQIINFLDNRFGNENLLLVLSVVIFLLFLVKNIFALIYIKYATNFLSYLTIYHQEKILKKMLSKDYNFFISKNSAEFIRDFLQEIKMLNGGFIQPILVIILNIFTILSFSIFLLTLNFIVTINIMIFALVFFFLFVLLYKKKFIYYGVQRRDKNLFIIQFIKQMFEGIRELKIYNKEFIFIDNLKKNLNRLANLGVSRAIITNLPKVILEVLLVLFFVLSILISEDPKTMMPVLAMYAAVSLRVLPNLNSLIRSHQRMNYSQNAVDALAVMLHEETRDNQNKTNKKVLFEKNIILKDVKFQFSDQKVIYENMNITINKNSCIGIKGVSGSGKSTFVDILCNLLKIKEGQILVDNQKIEEDSIEGLKQKISYIQQDVYLFDGSIYFNVALENDLNKIDYKKVDEILSRVELDDLRSEFNENQNKKIGEYGANISGGQAQRIGIARALYRSSEILIFDESFNNLDQLTRNKILSMVNIIKKNTTIIIISHDDSMFTHCDEIYEIKNKNFIKVK